MKKDKEKQIKIPFHPIVIVLFSVLFTFLVGGIVTGLNWTRLSRPKWKYPTIGISVVAFILYLYIFTFIPQSFGKFIVYISYGLFTAGGILMYVVQKPYYDRWKRGEM